VTVWDTVLFTNELDLLELRLQVLGSVVDRFVIVEARSTFTGLPKALNFRANEQRFAPWADQIAYLPVDLDPVADSPWDREHQQRAAQRSGLTDLQPNDLLLVGDVDEIPFPHIVRFLSEQLEEPTRLWQRQTLYRANWVVDKPWPEGTFACRGKHQDNPMVAHMLGRTVSSWGRYKEHYLPDAGWHFCFLGNEQNVQLKLASFSHQELNRERDRSMEHLTRLMAYRVDVGGRRLLSVQQPGELDRIQQLLRGLRPDLFDFTVGPPKIRRRAARSWVWARRWRGLAQGFVDWGDRRIDRSGAAAFAFVALCALLDLAREAPRGLRSTLSAVRRRKSVVRVVASSDTKSHPTQQ